MYIGANGQPYAGKTPEKFEAQKLIREGLLEMRQGVYTATQRREMVKMSQRGNAIKQVVSHLTAAIQEYESDYDFISQFTGQSSVLDPSLTQAFQSVALPFPYNLLNFIPVWVRAVFIVIAALLLTKCLAEPFLIMCGGLKDASLTFAQLFTATVAPKTQLVGLTRKYAKLTHLVPSDDIKMSNLKKRVDDFAIQEDLSKEYQDRKELETTSMLLDLSQRLSRLEAITDVSSQKRPQSVTKAARRT